MVPYVCPKEEAGLSKSGGHLAVMKGGSSNSALYCA
jgi:hypothetical protein